MAASPLRILVLGGTAWLGRQICLEAVGRGHVIWCLARGESGTAAAGAVLVRADRRDPDAYAAVSAEDWDAVIDVASQPGLVRSALAALGHRTRGWVYVSSASDYASHSALGADETAPVLAATDLDEVGMDLYGQAKVACEEACRASAVPKVLIARSGLIGGPGDPSDRAGYWVARSARAPSAPLLVPDAPALMTQVIDARDLAAWLISGVERGLVGTFDVVGEVMALEAWIALSRALGGHHGPVLAAAPAWLLAQGVQEFMGPDSLALWLADPDWRGFCARSGAAALGAGLTRRPVSETLADTLAWEREQGLGRVRQAGLSAEREAELVAKLASA